MYFDHVPHSIFIKPLNTFDNWPENPNYPNEAVHRTRQINTYDDWKIVPASRPLVNPPMFRENYVDLPGLYGSLDYSRAHMGLPIYGNRTGQWEFIVLNDFRPWEEAYSTIQHTIHGKRCFVVLEDDPDYYYVGNLKLNDWRSDPGWSRIVIEYNLLPFKYHRDKTKLKLTISGTEAKSIKVASNLIGEAPVFPWIKISPPNTSDPVKNVVSLTNDEIRNTQRITITKGSVYVPAPDLILSNESGQNEVSMTFYGSGITEATGPVSIEVLYTRRYM